MLFLGVKYFLDLLIDSLISICLRMGPGATSRPTVVTLFESRALPAAAQGIGCEKMTGGICKDCYPEDGVIRFHVYGTAEGKSECQNAFRRQATGHLKQAIQVCFLCIDGVDVYFCVGE